MVWAGSTQGAWAVRLHLLEPMCFLGQLAPQNCWGQANPGSFPGVLRRKDGVKVSPPSSTGGGESLGMA